MIRTYIWLSANALEGLVHTVKSIFKTLSSFADICNGMLSWPSRQNSPSPLQLIPSKLYNQFQDVNALMFPR